MTGPTRIELEPQLDIAQAAELHRKLCAGVAGGVPLVIDGSRVQQIDTAILQLLASLWLTCGQLTVPCTWDGISEELRRTATLIGLAEILRVLPPGGSRSDAFV